MQYLCEIIFLLVPCLTHSLEGHSYFKPNSYSTIVGPSNYFRHEEPFVPLNYRRDLITDESKRKEGPNRYSSKKNPFKHFTSEEDDISSERFTSGEYSSESNSAYSSENDSREFTIGTQIRVQHPITIPKKAPSFAKYPKSTSNGSYKSAAYNDYVTIQESQPESHSFPPKQRNKYTQSYDSSDAFHVVPAPHTAASSHNVYEQEQDDYRPLSKAKSAAYERYKGVASKKQIEKYLEDQQKILEEALKIQLLNDPKFHQYVSAKEKERLEKEHFTSEELVAPSPPPEFYSHFNENYNGNSGPRHPKSVDSTRTIISKPLIRNKVKPLPRRFRSALVINV